MLLKFFKFLFKVLLVLLIIPVVGVLFFKWVPVPATPLMAIRYFEQKKQDKPAVWKHDWVSLENISPHLQLAVICSEDQNFLKHNGFDVKAIEKALDQNQKRKRKRGASTISQQTAKNVFLWPQRSWLRKGMEVYVTFLIENIWSKERIMEVYLNSIEMGPGIYGAEAAAQYWYKKPAAKLTKIEAASIATILPNPLKYKANPPTPYVAGRRQWVMQQMRFFGNWSYDLKDER